VSPKGGTDTTSTPHCSGQEIAEETRHVPRIEMTERFIITLEAKPSTVPAIIRLRKLLKIAWRGLGLKCVKIKEGD